MDSSTYEFVFSLAKQFAHRLCCEGASAVLLTGSWVRGDAQAESDIDLIAIGNGPAYQLSRTDGMLVSVSIQSVREIRKSFNVPKNACWVVPGFRSAEILLDPFGVGATVKKEAQAWTWDHVGANRCDRWVAEEITGYAEEVHKLVHLASSNRQTGAAIQRYLLAVRLAPILAVHHRLLYYSENTLWNLVAETMGSEWITAQHQSLGLNNEPFDETVLAALRLYFLAAQEIKQLFSESQLDVVRHACALAGHDLL